MTLRSSAFWAKDAIVGGPIRKHLADIESLNSHSPESAAKKNRLLEDQIKFVTAQVPQYKGLKGTKRLTDFPVQSKESFRGREVDTYADGVVLESQFVASTSGSTGTPFRLLHDSNKRRRVDAEAIFFGRMAGYQIGVSLYHLKIWTERNSRSRFGYFVRNIKPLDVTQFGESEVSDLLSELSTMKNATSIIAYSSAIETVARVLSSRIIAPSMYQIGSIITQSEPLSREARKVISKQLGVLPVARYGMEEVGIIAQQALDLSGDYLLNQASHFIEVLKIESDEPAAPGELGRIVVTDLINRAQPLIRYDTGDLGTFSFDETTGEMDASRLGQLEGRGRERIFDSDDRPLAPMVAYNFWWRFPEILQYQIQQDKKATYLLRINANVPFEREKELVEAFKNLVGANSSISVEYATDGYSLKSGKRRSIVNNYSPVCGKSS